VAEYLTEDPIGTTVFKAIEASSITADKEDASFPASNAEGVKDQYVQFLSEDLTETTLTITFASAIDTLFIANINFTVHWITVNENSKIRGFVPSLETDRVNSVTYFDDPQTSIILTITAQATIDGASQFSIGAIAGGNRVVVKPRYPVTRKIIEPFDAVRFEKNNKEINNSFRPFTTFNINMKDVVDDSVLDSLKALVKEVGVDSSICVIENYDDRIGMIIGQIVGAVPFTEKAISHYDNVIAIKELT